MPTTPTATTALALSAATQVRFLSVTDYNGTPPALSVRVLDDTYSGSFSTVGSAVFVGTTAFASTAISPFASVYSLGTTVTPVRSWTGCVRPRNHDRPTIPVTRE